MMIFLALYFFVSLILMATWKVNNPDVSIVQALKAVYRSVFYGKN